MVSGNKDEYGTYTCETLAELDGKGEINCKLIDYFENCLWSIITIGCGYDPREWWDENTGLNQIVTTGKK